MADSDVMLVDGEERVRCQVCFKKPLPKHWFFAMWCDDCLDERAASGMTVEAFIAMKQEV